MRWSAVPAIAATFIVGAAHAATFYNVAQNTGVSGLSHNGRIATGAIATGFSGAPAWRWTPERGLEMIPDFFEGFAMSDWAQPIAGGMADASGFEVAAIAYSNASVVGPVLVGPFPGGAELDGFLSAAYGVSDDGIAVGLAYDDTSNAIAFRWSTATGMTKLPVNRPDNFSRANGISHDGNVAFGWNDQDDGYRTGVIWTPSETIDVLDQTGFPVGEAYASTPDGGVVVGGGYYTENGSEAWLWTAATGAQPIGILPEPRPVTQRMPASKLSARLDRTKPDAAQDPDGFLPPESFAFAVNASGNVVVGASGRWPIRTATVWTPETGLMPLADYVTARGVTIPDGWFLAAGTSISADGETIGGWGLDADGIMAGFIIDLHSNVPTDALLQARGTIGFNDLVDGPFAGLPVGTEVTMSFVMSPDGFELDPSKATSYPIRLETFQLHAGDASETLVATRDGPLTMLTNDYPMSDGIHLFSTPTASGQAFEFELFNPGGNLFDSDDLNRINRSFGPEFFEKMSWMVEDGNNSMWIQLDQVSINDVPSNEIFANGFDPQ